jgi:hypothetical protein
VYVLLLNNIYHGHFPGDSQQHRMQGASREQVNHSMCVKVTRNMQITLMRLVCWVKRLGLTSSFAGHGNIGVMVGMVVVPPVLLLLKESSLSGCPAWTAAAHVYFHVNSVWDKVAAGDEGAFMGWVQGCLRSLPSD